MPKLIIHSPAGTFEAADRQRVAGALTALGLDCEALPSSPLVRSTVWTYFADYAADAIFMGHEPARLPVVTLQIYVLASGLDDVGKRKLIEGATEILDRRPDGTLSRRCTSSSTKLRKKIGASSVSRPISPLCARAHPTHQQSDVRAFPKSIVSRETDVPDVNRNSGAIQLDND